MNKIRAESILVWCATLSDSVEEIENRILEEVDAGFLSQEDYQYLISNWNEVLKKNEVSNERCKKK